MAPKIKKIGAGIILFLIYIGTFSFPLFFQGCSTTSPLLSTRNDKASMIIEKPPVRIILSGEFSSIDEKKLINIMKELRKSPYHNYDFDDSITIDSEHEVVHTDNYNSKHKRR